MAVKKRIVLNVLSSLDHGGVEQMIYNYYSLLNKRFYEFIFIVHGEKIGNLEKMFIKMNCSVFHVTPKKRNFFRNFIEIYKIIKHTHPDTIYCHQGFSNIVPLYLSYKAKINVRISHAHGVSNKIPHFKKILQKFNNRFSTFNVACSHQAGDIVFGRNNYFVLADSIDSNKYAFNLQIRNQVRDDLCINKNDILLIQIGRLSKEKNFVFSINLLPKLPPNYKLLIIGKGDEKASLFKLVDNLDLNDRCIYIEYTNKIQNYLFASDIMLFPSTNEGLGIVAIEGQASGLPVLASNFISKETKFSELIQYLPFSQEIWLDKINTNLKSNYISHRLDYNECIKEHNYDLTSNKKIYKGIIDGKKSK